MYAYIAGSHGVQTPAFFSLPNFCIHLVVGVNSEEVTVLKSSAQLCDFLSLFRPILCNLEPPCPLLVNHSVVVNELADALHCSPCQHARRELMKDE